MLHYYFSSHCPRCAAMCPSGIWHSICSVSTHNSFVVDAVPSYSCSEVCSTLCEMRRRTRRSWPFTINIEMSQVVVYQVHRRAGPLHHWDQKCDEAHVQRRSRIQSKNGKVLQMRIQYVTLQRPQFRFRRAATAAQYRSSQQPNLF